MNNILYNESSECIIIAETHRSADNVWTQELRYRRISDKKYTVVQRDGVIYRDANSFEGFPAILFNVWVSEPDGGQDWLSINRLDLPSGEITTISTAVNFPIPEGYVDAWPSTLISAQGSGDCAICLVGLKKQTDIATFIVDYWLAKLNFSAKNIQLLTPVEDFS